MPHKYEDEAFVLDFLQGQYKERNHFYNLLGIHIEKAYQGHAVQTMKVELDKHTNLYANIHGGAIMSLGDSCMGVACASLGKKVVTLDMNINFISNVHAPAEVTAEANVIHNGKSTIVMSAKIFDAEGKVLSMMRSTYYVIGLFEELS